MKQLQLPKSVLPLFRVAGWPISNAFLQDLVPADHPAACVLGELNGLTVGDCSAGVECARSDIVFARDERLENNETIQTWQSLLGTKFICIGEVHHFHAALFMDASGACYQSSLVHEAFCFEGATFGSAVERILLGRKGQPMLRPGQLSVSMYGETITSSHPSVYRYEPRL